MDLNKKYERFIWRIGKSEYDSDVILKEEITFREVTNFINKHIEDKKFLINACLEKGRVIANRHKLMHLFNYYNPTWIAKHTVWGSDLQINLGEIKDIEEKIKVEDYVIPIVVNWHLNKDNDPLPAQFLSDTFLLYPAFYNRNKELKDVVYKTIIEEAKYYKSYGNVHNLARYKNDLEIDWKEVEGLAKKYVELPNYYSYGDDVISSYHRGL